MKSDVVVIGAGMAGLATGALLARAGYRVVVLEQGNQPGGRAYTHVDKGFTLNFGPHAMYRPHGGILSEILGRLGRGPIAANYPSPKLAFWADGERFGSVGAKPHEAMTTKLFPLMTRVRMAPLIGAIRFAKPERIAPELTYGEWVDAHTRDPLLRRFARALGTVNTYTRPSEKLSARFLVRHLHQTMFEKDYVGYVSGGWSAIYDVFIDAMRAHGGELVTGARVERIEQENGRAAAVVANGTRYEAQAFVCTLPPQDAPSIADAASALGVELDRWSRLEDVRALCMDLGFSSRLRTDLTYIFDIERDLYYSLHSEVTPDLAPPGAQLMHAMAYLSPEEANDETLRRKRQEELTAGLDRWFAGWRDAVVLERTLPNTRVVGARRTPDQCEGAMPMRSASTPNLYFANDARDVPYNLTLGCLASAVEVADAIGREYMAHGASATETPAPVAV